MGKHSEEEIERFLDIDDNEDMVSDTAADRLAAAYNANEQDELSIPEYAKHRTNFRMDSGGGYPEEGPNDDCGEYPEKEDSDVLVLLRGVALFVVFLLIFAFVISSAGEIYRYIFGS